VYQTVPQDTDQANRGSNFQAVFYIETSTNNLTDGVLTVSNVLQPDASDNSVYNFQSIHSIYNVVGNFYHVINSIKTDGNTTQITPLSPYSFTNGMILQITADVLSITGSNVIKNVRNGATVNFNQQQRSVNNFSRSLTIVETVQNPQHTINFQATAARSTPHISDGIIIGASTITADSITGPGTFYTIWDQNNTSYFGTIAPIPVDGTSTLAFTLNGSGTFTGDATIQAIILESTAPVSDTNPGALIGYSYIPNQSQTATSISLQPVAENGLIISNNGWGAGNNSYDVYPTPIEQIPVTLLGSVGDQVFIGDPLQFENYTATGGFIKIPVLIGGGVNMPLILSSPTTDVANRQFYTACSTPVTFTAEGLQKQSFRKLMVPVLAQALTSSGQIMAGEYVLAIFTASTSALDNIITNNGIAVYKLDGRPLIRL
jgi:hypothetical protein